MGFPLRARAAQRPHLVMVALEAPQSARLLVAPEAVEAVTIQPLETAARAGAGLEEVVVVEISPEPRETEATAAMARYA